MTPDLAAAVAAAAFPCGFCRQEQRLLWLRRLPRVVGVIAMCVDEAGETSLESGVWLPDIAVMLRQPDKVVDVSQCLLRFAGHHLDTRDQRPCEEAFRKAAQQVDGVRTFTDAYELIIGDERVVHPAGSRVRDLYIAATAILEGWSGALSLAEVAAAHCKGDPVLSPAANHLYAMVATAE